MCVSGVSFLFYLFPFLSLHQKHSIPCFWCFFLFIFFLCTPRTRVCMFWWLIYIIFIFAPWDTHYMHVCRGFFFFFIFCSSLHPSNPFQPADMRYKPPDMCFKPPAACFGHLRPQPTCFDHLRPPATRSLAPQALKHMYKQSYVYFFFHLFFFGFGNTCTSSRTCISDVFIYSILFYST